MDKFLNSKYARYLIKNATQMEKDLQKFNSEIKEHLNRKTDELNTILKCHLTIEYYIDNYLKVSYPTIINWDKLRLTFIQKLELANNPRTLIGMHYKSIKCMNAIRNKFVHNISYKIKTEDYKDIENIMNIWYKASGRQNSTDLKMIIDFTIWICGILDSMTNGIEKESKELGLSGYLIWLKEMQDIE